MELEYTITPDDTCAYEEYRSQRSPSAMWAMAFLFVFFFLLGFAWGMVDIASAYGLHPLLLGLVVGLITAAFIGALCLATVVLPRVARRLRWRRAGYPVSACCIALTEDGVEYGDDRIRVRWDWRAVKRIIVDKQYLFIRAVSYACMDQGHAAITIPRAAFESARQMDAFLALLDELKNSAGRPS